MAGRVDQMQLVHLAVACLVFQRGGLRLDGDAALALQIHGVKHLRLHFTRRQTAAQLDDAVCQRRFAVVDVGDNGKVADVFHQ